MERNGTRVKSWEENILSREVKRELYESVAIPMWYKAWILGRVRKSIIREVRVWGECIRKN